MKGFWTALVCVVMVLGVLTAIGCETAKGAGKDIEHTVKTQVSTAYTKVNLATQEQLKKMEHRIQDLERKLAQKTKPAAGAKAAARPKRRASRKKS